MAFWKKDKSINKFGYNGDVGSAEVDIWEYNRPYNWLDAATRLYASSSSENDFFGGSGAWSITLLGLNENWSEQDEVIVLDGQNRIQTDKFFYRTFRIKVETAGGGIVGKNEGTIYIHNSTVTAGVPDDPDKVYAIITPGHNQTLMALWTSPANKSLYLADWWASMSVDVGVAKATEVHLYIRPAGGVFQLRYIFHLSDSNWRHGFLLPLLVAPRSDVTIRAHASSGPGAAVSAGFSGWYGM